MLLALKVGNKERKKTPIALELFPADLDLLDRLYKLIESAGGSGSKLKTGPIKSWKILYYKYLTAFVTICELASVNGDTPLMSESIICLAMLRGIGPW